MPLASTSLNLDVDCSIPQIKEQLTQFPVSMEIYNLLHQKESERVRYSGHKYRRGVQRILKSLLNKLKMNARAKRARVDPRSKTNGGDGRVDPRSKTNGGDGRVELRNQVRGGQRRQTKTISESKSRRVEPDLHGLRDFWWHHWQDAALIASCCASHEAAVHTFWSDEEFLVNLHAATTGSISIVRKTLSVLDRISEHMYHTRIIY